MTIDGQGLDSGAAGSGPLPPEPDSGLSFAPLPPPPPLSPAQLQEAALRAEASRLAGSNGADGGDPRYEALKAEVDALQALVARQQQPWYRDAASIVAILALVFSFGTTVVSYQRTAQEDIHASEIELRALITRLSAIPAEMTESAKTYADDPGAVAALASVLTQEQILIAKQAAQVLRGIPEERVTAAQYLLVANVLLANGIDADGLALLDDAIGVARDVNDFVSAVRVKAFRFFGLGRIDEGRELYRQALEVWNRRGFETEDEAFRDYTDLQTRVGWAEAELSVGNCDEARAQLAEARRLSGRFGSGDTQVRRMEQVDAALASCQPGATTAPGSSSAAP